jgi:hypothetical protein
MPHRIVIQSDTRTGRVEGVCYDAIGRSAVKFRGIEDDIYVGRESSSL